MTLPHFPLEELSPEDFEIFVTSLLEMLFPQVQVHRLGTSGHDQDGSDVEAILPNGESQSYQCKRHAQFGPAKVEQAVADYHRNADQKFIVLSRIASPAARDAMAKHPNWRIWDRDDLTRKIHNQLAREQQIKLVDQFFPGKRFALLGENEAGPWQTAETFFAPFSDHRNGFHHDWPLIGRSALVDQLKKNIRDGQNTLLLIVAAGGGGKSRLLKAAFEHTDAERYDVIRFLSPTESVSAKHLDDLGRGRKLLIVDDAHDRVDLAKLFEYAASAANQARLILALRPYGLTQIEQQASRFALAGDKLYKINVPLLSLVEVTELATQALTAFDGPVHLAKDIAELTRDCLLATVLGAQVVAQQKIPLEFAKNETIFRHSVLGRLPSILSERLGGPADQPHLMALLRILALVQPFGLDDRPLFELIEASEGITASDARRLLKRLLEAGVIFRRGVQHRLSPDLLADHIIESEYLGPNDGSTGKAEQLFDRCACIYAEHILVNLGRLDWRRANGDPTGSRLLDGLWSRLSLTENGHDPHMKAVIAVAYFQPGRVLDLAERLIRDGALPRQLSLALKNAAYNLQHLRRACECLWALGKDDERPLNQHPEHAIRVLKELGQVELNKPFEYNEEFVSFALDLMRQSSAWTEQYTPYDILAGVMQGEGEETTGDARSITICPFVVRHDFIAPLRKRVIDATIARLDHPERRIAVASAKFCNSTLRYPMPIYGLTINEDELKPYELEFANTLTQISELVAAKPLSPIVHLELASAVSWHAQGRVEHLAKLAQAVGNAFPDTLDFQLVRALLYPHDTLVDPYDEHHQDRSERRTQDLIKRLQAAFPVAHDLLRYIENCIQQFFLCPGDAKIWSLGALTYASPSFAKVVLTDARERSGSLTKPLVVNSFFSLVRHDRALCLVEAKAMLEGDDLGLHRQVARSVGVLIGDTIEKDDPALALFYSLASTNNVETAVAFVNSLSHLTLHHPQIMLSMLLHMNFGISNSLVNEALALICNCHKFSIDGINIEYIRSLLEKLKHLPALEDHWIETFLSNISASYPSDLVRFFKERVEFASKAADWKFRPVNYFPWGHVPLRFRETDQLAMIAGDVLGWMADWRGEAYPFINHASHLFKAMFLPFEQEIVSTFREFLQTRSVDRFAIVTALLREAQTTFVFDQLPFVIELISTARGIDSIIMDDLSSALYASATFGVRSGIPGKPFPQDLALLENATEALKRIDRFSPAYSLYDDLRQRAESAIERAQAEGRVLYDEIQP